MVFNDLLISVLLVTTTRKEEVNLILQPSTLLLIAQQIQ